MPMESAAQPPASPPASRGAALGMAAMLLGVVAGAGSLLFALVAHGMSKESRGRSIEGAGDGSDEVLGAIGCVGAIFALVGALPFAARHFDRVAEGPRPVGWLLLWLALSLAGWLFQTRKGESPAREPGEPSPRRRRTHATGGR